MGRSHLSALPPAHQAMRCPPARLPTLSTCHAGCHAAHRLVPSKTVQRPFEDRGAFEDCSHRGHFRPCIERRHCHLSLSKRICLRVASIRRARSPYEGDRAHANSRA